MYQSLIVFFTFLIIFSGCNSQSKSVNNHNPDVGSLSERKTKLTSQQIANADSLNIDFQLRGHCYAYSSEINSKPSNGEGRSNNIPQTVDKNFPVNNFYLVINQYEYCIIENFFLGCKLYLVNTTDEKKQLRASDSRLNIIAEALNEKGEWQPITYLPSSWCGNSYHTVILDKNEYWEFDIPIFKGDFKTKIRYTLIDNDSNITSNEITAYINKGQFDEKRQQGYSAINMMDPYNE